MDEAAYINQGCVVYSETTDGLQAEWIFRRNGSVESGTGVAIRMTEAIPESRFEGTYEITYQNKDGNKSPTLKLTISFKSDHYQLLWSRDGETTDLGIGMLSGGKLIASYSEVS